MEADVLRAMAKWPNVPDVYGWLRLDVRGQWLLRGQRIIHSNSRAFIAANYACDLRGCWFFQNGPQRVFVSLEATPWIFHAEGLSWVHQGDERVEKLLEVLIDEAGCLYFATEWGLGMVDDRDLTVAVANLCQSDGHSLTPDQEHLLMESPEDIKPGMLGFRWHDQVRPTRFVPKGQLASRFGFILEPRED